ncbi:pirin domain-containing protein [Abortiporus biennis]|nr:pirin domain-containing protein [Abortiporus biennis]
MTSSNSTSAKIIPRLSNERGQTNIGWLNSFHTFSVASYIDLKHERWGCLRVMNEDRVEAHTGFPLHNHQEFEIFSYIISGELEHNDSMGNMEILKRGDIQMTSAGTGIRHSEYAHGEQQVHFIQIWSIPEKHGLSPQYFTRHFTDEEKKDKFVKVVSHTSDPEVEEKRDGSGPAPIHSPLTLYASLLSPGSIVNQTINQSKAFIHVIQSSGYNGGMPNGGSIRVNKETELREGDGAYIARTDIAFPDGGNELVIENVGRSVIEVLLFSLG